MKNQVFWDKSSVNALYELPFFELVSRAYAVHTANFDPAKIEFATLSNIKSGACPEDCGYCSQSGHYNTEIKKQKLCDLDTVIEQAKLAKANGADRFCMGAAWRSPPKADFPKVLDMIKAVKALGLDTCVTLGMLDQEQSAALKAAGLDFYNHNLDTSPEYYKKIITTRTYQDRLDTLQCVSDAGIKVCCGGILGMGETREDRVQLLLELHHLPTAPESIPFNKLIVQKGTPLEHAKPLDDFEYIRTIAVARIMFPTSYLRLGGGRESMSPTVQAWCFMAGANSFFIGDKLLTSDNAARDVDLQLLQQLGLELPAQACADAVC